MAKVAKINAYHCRCSPTTSRSCRRRPTATARCSITSRSMYGAGMADSNSHSPLNIPMILAGAARASKGGRHIQFQEHAARQPAPDAARPASACMSRRSATARGASMPRSSRCRALLPLAAVALLSTFTLSAAPDTALVAAIRKRDAAGVQALLKQGVNPNTPQGDGSTPLHWAAHVDDVTIVDLLIRAGARANVSNDTGFTAVHVACVNRNGAVAGRLLAAGALPNAASRNGETGTDDLRADRSGRRRSRTAVARRARQRRGDGPRPDRPDVGGVAGPPGRRQAPDRRQGRRRRQESDLCADGRQRADAANGSRRAQLRRDPRRA